MKLAFIRAPIALAAVAGLLGACSELGIGGASTVATGTSTSPVSVLAADLTRGAASASLAVDTYQAAAGASANQTIMADGRLVSTGLSTAASDLEASPPNPSAAAAAVSNVVVELAASKLPPGVAADVIAREQGIENTLTDAINAYNSDPQRQVAGLPAIALPGVTPASTASPAASSAPVSVPSTAPAPAPSPASSAS